MASWLDKLTCYLTQSNAILTGKANSTTIKKWAQFKTQRGHPIQVGWNGMDLGMNLEVW